MRRYELFPGHMLVTPAETIVEINDVSDNYNGQLLLYSDIPATAAFEIPYFAADLFGLGPATILPFLDFRGISGCKGNADYPHECYSKIRIDYLFLLLFIYYEKKKRKKISLQICRLFFYQSFTSMLFRSLSSDEPP